ncbi:choice-of-anchor Q domain-containing protein [Hymenobacter terricola]|uniref:choice-of-anchor Q domain-containing protein n=1 Tax=Hymenobacter terricola TaxID=2819236 RepID=UPI001B308C52|nr:choice-of-anchor Q domain-containing protein [Hymenobacter terricola]
MKKLLFTLLLGAGCSMAAVATPYYVSSGAGSSVTGVDATTGGQGLSPTLPFATIQFAANQAHPGDIVYVRAGTYSSSASYKPVLSLDADDANSTLKTQYSTTSAANKIIFQNYQSESPLIKADNVDNAILIRGKFAYIDIVGFRIQGNNGNVNGGVPNAGSSTVVTDPAGQPGGCKYEETQNGPGTPKYNTNGIAVVGSAGNIPNHIRVLSNEVFECGGAGIAASQADYVTIDRNVVYNNCWYTVYGSSGITINSSRNLDTNAGYHIIITHNKCFNNRLYVSWFSKTYPTPAMPPYGNCKGITDGNGIILDKNNDYGYTGAFQVANNLCVANGGAGIQVFKTKNADLINNTCYRNSHSGELRGIRGEVFINETDNVLVQNNIFSTNAGAKTYGLGAASTGLSFTNNLFFDSDTPTSTPTTGANIVKADPGFQGAGVDPATANFALNPGSPAINQGLNTLSSGQALNYLDLAGNTRVVGTVDLGAYEVQAAARTALATSTPGSTSSQFGAYPNPFSGAVTLAYTLDRPGPVRLEVFDLLGRRVALLVNETRDAGRHEARFEAPSQAAALYQVRLTTAEGTTAQKLASQP